LDTMERDEGVPHRDANVAAPERGTQVTDALHACRAAESAMRRRTQAATRLGDNAIVALHYVVEAMSNGRMVGPKDIARHLGISSASVTVLLDRLEQSGRVRRENSPVDRRALIIVPTAQAHEELPAMFDGLPEKIVQIAEKLTPTETHVVVHFLQTLQAAVDEIHIDRLNPQAN
jgi:DNA-binding MarR family transcriptional regulator